MPRTTLHVTGFPVYARARDLAGAFERYGYVCRCDIPPPRPSRTRPFAFVEYEDPRDAEDAYYRMRDHRVLGKYLDIQWARPDRKAAPTGRGNRRSPPSTEGEEGAGGEGPGPGALGVTGEGGEDDRGPEALEAIGGGEDDPDHVAQSPEEMNDLGPLDRRVALLLLLDEGSAPGPKAHIPGEGNDPGRGVRIVVVGMGIGIGEGTPLPGPPGTGEGLGVQ
ncbi:MAG: hypothetical protein DHS80DRAFT_29338 [Piptocephalis tieghemiana]|nr:MAG: hypothetical protein DHS80DRAFT_29338 [Piptocephalis tieghemiana]